MYQLTWTHGDLSTVVRLVVTKI